MFSTHRHARCQALLNALPPHDSPQPGKTMRELLALLDRHYRDCAPKFDTSSPVFGHFEGWGLYESST